ncbi:glycoside hydrolase family 5 protein [Nocardia sp. NPDC055053]
MKKLATVLLLLGTFLVPLLHGSPPAEAEPVGMKGPLSTRGRYIVDADGNRVKLKSGNWHGSSGTWNGSGDKETDANHHAEENGHRAPLGLDRVSVAKLIADFKALGLNSIRLPFSNEMLTDPEPVLGLTANPELNGLTPLEVFDRAVTVLTSAGFGVILNNHTTTTRWCCALDGNEFWNSGQSWEKFISDWVFITSRYRDNPGVVGADLRNEVRRTTWTNPNWGQGDSNDWADAAQEAGDAILTQGNPDLLIVVEGINWMGIPTDITWHERPMLEPMKRLSTTLVRSNKVVYGVHFYGYIGPNHTGATGTGETHDPRFRDMSRADLFKSMDERAGYVAGTPDKHFTAPVWVSEFGVGKGDSDLDKAWFANMVDYLVDRDLDFAYWPIVGFHENDKGNQWGLLRYDTSGALRNVLDADDWRAPHVRRLFEANGFTGQVPVPARNWSMLQGIHEDDNRSLRAAADWDSGAHKMVCPDGQRLIGVSDRGQGGLCTDATVRELWQPGADAVKVDSETVRTDWANGFTKYQCAEGSFMIGYSLNGDAMSGILCAPGSKPLAGAGRTLWFDRGDNRPASGEGGDWAEGYYKGQCNADEYVAGIAFSGANRRGNRPQALYCRTLS